MVNISFESDLLIPSFAKVISNLVDRARVCLDNIHYDEANRIVNIYIERKELIGFKKSLLGEMQPVYGPNTIRSLLKIKHVEEMNIKVDDRLLIECNSCFTILFGMKMEGNRLYLSSAEEFHGNTLCQIIMRVDEVSIEFHDLSN